MLADVLSDEDITRLQKIYNVLENGDKEEIEKFFSNFNYYDIDDIGDIIYFIELLKFNVD